MAKGFKFPSAAETGRKFPLCCMSRQFHVQTCICISIKKTKAGITATAVDLLQLPWSCMKIDAREVPPTDTKFHIIT